MGVCLFIHPSICKYRQRKCAKDHYLTLRPTANKQTWSLLLKCLRCKTEKTQFRNGCWAVPGLKSCPAIAWERGSQPGPVQSGGCSRNAEKQQRRSSSRLHPHALVLLASTMQILDLCPQLAALELRGFFGGIFSLQQREHQVKHN